MQEEEQKQSQQPDSDDLNAAEETPERVSAFRNAREMAARERRKAEIAERERQKEEEEAAYQAREEYAKELYEDKVDLIRLKQGVITDSDRVFPEQEGKKHYTIWQRLSNWFYHSKWWLGIAAFCTIVIAYLAYDIITHVTPDVSMMILTDNHEVYTNARDLCDWLQGMCEDYNDDDKVYVQSVYIPISKDQMEGGNAYSMTRSTQLTTQMETATSMLVLANDEANEYMSPELLFEDMERLYPDCPYAKGYRLCIAGTEFEKQLHLEHPLSADTYLAIRIPMERMSSLEEMQESYNHAKGLLDVVVQHLDEKPKEAAANE